MVLTKKELAEIVKQLKVFTIEQEKLKVAKSEAKQEAKDKIKRNKEMDIYFKFRNSNPCGFYEALLFEMLAHEEQEGDEVNWSDNAYIEENFIEEDSMLSLAYLVDNETYQTMVRIRKEIKVWLKEQAKMI